MCTANLSHKSVFRLWAQMRFYPHDTKKMDILFQFLVKSSTVEDLKYVKWVTKKSLCYFIFSAFFFLFFVYLSVMDTMDHKRPIDVIGVDQLRILELHPEIFARLNWSSVSWKWSDEREDV